MLAATAFSLGPAFLGLNGTSDLCDGAYDDAFDNVVDMVVVECIDLRRGIEHVDTRVNWEGAISAFFFPLGVFFASAGILGLIDRRRAAFVTAACVAICFAMVVVFFA